MYEMSPEDNAKCGLSHKCSIATFMCTNMISITTDFVMKWCLHFHSKDLCLKLLGHSHYHSYHSHEHWTCETMEKSKGITDHNPNSMHVTQKYS